jgi:hypothetical protein
VIKGGPLCKYHIETLDDNFMRPFKNVLNHTNLAFVPALEYDDPIILDDWKILLVINNKRILQRNPLPFQIFISLLQYANRYIGLRYLRPGKSAILFCTPPDSTIWPQRTELPVFLRVSQSFASDSFDILILELYTLYDGLLGVPTLLGEFLSLLAFALVPLDRVLNLSDLFKSLCFSGGIAPWPHNQLTHGGWNGMGMQEVADYRAIEWRAEESGLMDEMRGVEANDYLQMPSSLLGTTGEMSVNGPCRNCVKRCVQLEVGRQISCRRPGGGRRHNFEEYNTELDDDARQQGALRLSHKFPQWRYYGAGCAATIAIHSHETVSHIYPKHIIVAIATQ